MATLDLSNASFPPRVYTSGFLRLPREIRDIIYADLLVQPDYLSRRHSAFCKLSDRGSGDPETPPFMISCPSRCSRRHGLSLLLASRHVHNEAAPIFWGRNMHFFQSPAKFSQNVGRELRDQCRQYLQHVQIGYRTRSEAGGRYLESDDKVWETIFLCKNLRILEMEPKFVQYNERRFSKLCASLPHLGSLIMAEMHRYRCRTSDTGTADEKYIWIKITKKFPLHQTWISLFDVVRDFSTNHVVHVDFELNKDLLRPPPYGPRRASPLLAPYLKDNNNIQTVTLRDRTITDLTIYGLPNSAATRASHFRQRLFEQNRRKAAGLPSMEEEALADRMNEVRMEKKEQLKTEEEDAQKREQGEKKLEQEKFWEEQTIAESKNRKNQRTHKQRKVRKAEKIKQEERKRVPKTS